MSNFHFDNQLSELTKMDGPMQNAPMMRWQRKALDRRAVDSSIKMSGSDQAPTSPWKQRLMPTPSKTKTPSHTRTTINTPGKTPGKSESISSKTPNKKTPKTPKYGGQDRFIPNRSTTDMEMGHYVMTSTMTNENDPLACTLDEGYKQHLDGALARGCKPGDSKIFSYTNKAPLAREGHMNNLKVLYSSNKSQTQLRTSRYIPQLAERILDAPDLMDDYYLNLLDWSSSNYLAVSLGNGLYLWNASNSSIAELFQLESAELYIASVSWIQEANILAVGISNGCVQLWDVTKEKLIRSMGGHAARVGCLSWNSYILSSGSRTGAIHQHDVRVATHQVGLLQNHTQEVCGLKWSPDGKYLASGGNDNLVNVWDVSLGSRVSPLSSFNQHQAAVKALAWCPWQPNMLASGGGTADRHIRFWNVNTGTCLQATDTKSQVSALAWSPDFKEIISGHGYSQNQLSIWKYPKMDKIVDLTGHSARVLCLTMSPDHQFVASAAADETIRLWKCFSLDKHKAGSTVKTATQQISKLNMMRAGIR